VEVGTPCWTSVDVLQVWMKWWMRRLQYYCCSCGSTYSTTSMENRISSGEGQGGWIWPHEKHASIIGHVRRVPEWTRSWRRNIKL